MIKLTLLSVFLWLLHTSCTSDKIEVASPSQKLSVEITNEQSRLSLHLFESNNLILQADIAGFIFNENISWNEYEISGVKQTFVDEHWSPVYGERSVVQDKYNGIVIALKGKNKENQSLKIDCRVYDEGIAFRYLFDATNSKNLVLSKELTKFDFDGDYEAWISDRAQSEYKKVNLSTIREVCERPLVIKRNDSSFLALGEAALVDYARMKFKTNPEKSLSIAVELASTVDLEKANFKSPWRYVMVAKSPGELLENNYFIENLNDPNAIEDISWIKPGKVIREVTLTTLGGLACVDFAANHNLQYVEFDAGWYGPEGDEESDASTITVDPKRSPGPLDLHRVIAHAKKKDIGIILYVNRRALEKQLDEILPLYQSWGIKGLKYGFVNVGSQEWTSWLHEAIRKAAKYHLLVDVHDEYRPTGYSRTYPNFMTQEGIRGDEESPTTAHTLTTLFTRMIAGAGDNTNCYLAPRVVEKMGGKAAQMAKAVMMYSPWQFLYWYDRPEGSPHKKGGAGSAQGLLNETENLNFYDALPTVWNETKVLEGAIGEHATIARKNGAAWFVGSLTAGQSRAVEIPLTFLDNNEKYEAEIYFQSKEDFQNNTVSVEKLGVDRDSILRRELAKDAGFAVIIKKI